MKVTIVVENGRTSVRLEPEGPIENVVIDDMLDRAGRGVAPKVTREGDHVLSLSLNGGDHTRKE